MGALEKIHRFALFSDDARQRIRGQGALELTGGPVRKPATAQRSRGLALQRPAAAFQELVPNV